MPIISLVPSGAAPYLQDALSANSQIRVVISCSNPILFMAMTRDDLNKYLQNLPCNAFAESWLTSSENRAIEFVIPASVPWAMVFTNKGPFHTAVYWQNFVRPL